MSPGSGGSRARRRRRVGLPRVSNRGGRTAALLFVIRLGRVAAPLAALLLGRAAAPLAALLLGLAAAPPAAFLLGLAAAPAAYGQHGGDPSSAPPPPAGPGRLQVQLVSSDGDAALEGLSIALYALSPDGRPGFVGGETDASGQHTFEGISNDPSIVYLVGARYAGIPFGERVAFEEGVENARIEIQVSRPIDRLERVSIEELRARFDWMGDRVVVTEIVRLSSGAERVIQLPEDDVERAIFARRLPPGAREFEPGPASAGDGLARVGDHVRFWGPLYPGEQRVEYRYSLPVEQGATRLRWPIELRESAGRLVVVAGTEGLGVEGPGLVASRTVEDEGQRPLASWARAGLAEGERLAFELRLPEARVDPLLVRLPRADVWLDLDDTRLQANVELQLEVPPGAPVAGTAAEPLLHVALPPGAELSGVTQEAESWGLVPTADGGFDVIGPLGPGEHALGFAYTLPSRREGVDLVLSFPREVATLNVLVADNGLAIESRRLHRRRPFRNRTRNYLHREAYNVGAGETVDLRLEPLQASGLPREASMALTVAAAAGAALFLMSPLRSAARREAAGNERLDRIREEREAVYASIRDLDHDYETGKIEEQDYGEMRADFLAQAIELMRAERDEEGRPAMAGPLSGDPPVTEPRLASSPPVATPTTGRFCPSCGERVDEAWRFCSHCGGDLNSPSAAPDGAASA